MTYYLPAILISCSVFRQRSHGKLLGHSQCEMYYLSKFKDSDSLVAAIEQYIYFYNYERRQRKLNKMSPMMYRQFVENAA
ncbi:IS3 family transposase [Desulfosporosinus meridiei]|uniref:IS3 family transposase n=1 Tax=Desulfosporosinus meridiei TaxID=79209 RepID=UPI003CFEF598